MWLSRSLVREQAKSLVTEDRATQRPVERGEVVEPHHRGDLQTGPAVAASGAVSSLVHGKRPASLPCGNCWTERMAKRNSRSRPTR